MPQLEIIDLPDGELITKPGFYRLPLSRHHNQPCDGPSVTSGILRKMELESPADVWAFHKLNPNRWPSPEPSPTMLQGQAMALLIEGGEDMLLREFFVRNEDTPRKPTAAQIKAANEGRATEAALVSIRFWAEVEARGMRELTQEACDELVSAYDVLTSDEAAIVTLGGEPEITMAWKDGRTGIWILSRPDNLSGDGIISDYKRVSAAGQPFSERLIDRRITDYGYDMQMALAADAFERLTGGWPSAVGLVCQATKPPYHVILREISEEDLRIAQWRNRRALMRFAECLASGNWPGPGDVPGVYYRPEWQRDMLLKQMDTEGDYAA